MSDPIDPSNRLSTPLTDEQLNDAEVFARKGNMPLGASALILVLIDEAREHRRLVQAAALLILSRAMGASEESKTRMEEVVRGHVVDFGVAMVRAKESVAVIGHAPTTGGIIERGG